MSHVNTTNNFFKKTYSNLADVALSPISWAFKRRSNYWEDYCGLERRSNYDDSKLMLAAVLSPVLVPATIYSIAFTLCLAAVAALIHGVSLIVAEIADIINEPNYTWTIDVTLSF
jgi:hypothetical protein